VLLAQGCLSQEKEIEGLKIRIERLEQKIK